MLISTICSRRVVTAHVDDSLIALARKMRDEHVGTVVVIGAKRIPIGVITDRDVVVGGLAQAAERFADLTAGDIMTPDPVVVWESDTLEVAIAYMAGRGVRRLPVVNNHGGLCGVVSYEDIVNRLAHHLTRAVDHTVIQHRVEIARRQ